MNLFLLRATSQAVVADEVAQHLYTGLDAVQGQEFIRLVRLVDIPWPQNDGVHAQLLQQRSFRTEGHAGGGVAGEPLGDADQLRIRVGEEGRQSRKQRFDGGLHLEAFGNGQYALANLLAHLLDLHAGQQPYIELEVAVATDAVGVVAPVNAAQVQGRPRDGE